MATKKSSGIGKRDVVQVKNPRTGHYVKIDRSAGKIVSISSLKDRIKASPSRGSGSDYLQSTGWGRVYQFYSQQP